MGEMGETYKSRFLFPVPSGYVLGRVRVGSTQFAKIPLLIAGFAMEP
jgi:uncharacterized protein YgiB involved in biofilm formation